MQRRFVGLLSCSLVTGLACADASSGATEADATTGGDESEDGDDGDASTGPSSSGDPSGDPTTGSGVDTSDGGDSSDGTDTGVPTIDPQVPSPTGRCPAIVDGDVEFAPAGMPPRTVRLYVGDDAAADAPLVLYWHATGSFPEEAEYSLGASLASFGGQGGIVAAPYADPTAGTFEWFIVNQSSQEDDFLLADEIVACLHEAGRIDPRRIHSMGMSAGALQTTAFSFLRSGYLASVATYSGGLPAGFSVPDQEPDNPFAALVFFGGASDLYGPLDFAAASEAYAAMLREGGRFAPLCDHGGGHNIPLDAAPSVLEFFAAHPFGTSPSPYADGLPESFPDYCALPEG